MPLPAGALAAVDQFAAKLEQQARERGVNLSSKDTGFVLGLVLGWAIQSAKETDDPEQMVAGLLNLGLGVTIAAHDDDGTEWVHSLIDRWVAE